MSKHPLEQELLDDYKKRHALYINICYLLHQSERDVKDKDLYELAMKKAAGVKQMIDYLEKINVIDYNKQ